MSTIEYNGRNYDFDAAVNLMDPELCDHLHSTQPWGMASQDYFDAYVAAHLVRFEEEFCID